MGGIRERKGKNERKTTDMMNETRGERLEEEEEEMEKKENETSLP